MSLNWLDIVLIVVMGASMFISARRGFSREVIGLGASLFALVAAMWFYGIAGSFLAPFVKSVRVANLIGFLLIIFAVLMGGGVLGLMVNRFLRTIGLSFFDMVLGAVFGLARGLLVVVALLTAYLAFGPVVNSRAVSSSMLNSQIAPFVLDASRVCVSMAPMELKSSFLKRYAELESVWKKNAPARNDKRPADRHERKF